MTDAERIALLEEENAWLRRELGDQVTATETHAIRRALNIERKQALLLLRLYRARGRVVTHHQLAEVLGLDVSTDAPKVQFSRLRNFYRLDLVENAWGLGYALNDAGLALIGAALGELQARAA